MWLLIGGFLCGIAAGAAARYGRICSMSAIEDALIAKDFRAAKAWGLALAVAILSTQVMALVWAFDLKASVYTTGHLDLLGALLGGLMFGFGMAMVGTCSFGLLVRAGSGDMRAIVSAAVVGIAAFAFTAGVLSPLRMQLAGLLTVDLAPRGGPLIPGLLAPLAGTSEQLLALSLAGAIAVLLAGTALADRRLRKRPRLLLAAVALGAAFAAGWAVTAFSVDRMETRRLESLSFVAPVGRLLLQVMTDSLKDVGFGVASVAGVFAGALITAVLKDEIRREAFDDVREMRRHMLGAVLMGCGGVLARGCTIGQGMSAASALAISAPLVVLGVVLGAKIGLSLLLEGRALWRMGANG